MNRDCSEEPAIRRARTPRAVAWLMAVSILAGGTTLVARAGESPTRFPCANVVDSAGSYDPITGDLLVFVTLAAPRCEDSSSYDPASGRTIALDFDVAYELSVTSDAGWDPSDPVDPRVFDAPLGEDLILTPSRVERRTRLDGTSFDLLVYEANFGDNDPTVCLVSNHEGTVTTTVSRRARSTSGTVVESVTTEQISDRSPARDCLAVNDAWDAVNAEAGPFTQEVRP